MGGSNSTGTTQYIYLRTANGPMPITAIVNGVAYAVHSDHLNTPRKLTQPDGQVAWQWAYSAFGDEQPTLGSKRFTDATTTPTTGTTTIPEVTFNLRYPGQYYDKESNLHYNYFRSYSAERGRYTQADPIGLDGGFNRFGYVGGDALNAVDPNGLFELPSLPQGVVDFSAGFGDVASFGLTEYIRQGYEIGSVNSCSAAYMGGQVTGIVGAAGALAAGGTAINIGIGSIGGVRTLYHFTSSAKLAGITADGYIAAHPGLYGTEVYATAINSRLWAMLSGASSTEAVVVIQGSRAIATPWPGIFRILGNFPVR